MTREWGVRNHSTASRVLLFTVKGGNEEMDHMKKHWKIEEQRIRQAARMQKVRLSYHVDQRMNERDFTEYDLMIILLTGKIVEGYDIGQYPNYRNPDPLRIFVGENEGKKIAVGIAIGQKEVFSITTCFQIGQRSRHNRHF